MCTSALSTTGKLASEAEFALGAVKEYQGQCRALLAPPPAPLVTSPAAGAAAAESKSGVKIKLEPAEDGMTSGGEVVKKDGRKDGRERKEKKMEEAAGAAAPVAAQAAGAVVVKLEATEDAGTAPIRAAGASAAAAGERPAGALVSGGRR